MIPFAGDNGDIIVDSIDSIDTLDQIGDLIKNPGKSSNLNVGQSENHKFIKIESMPYLNGSV